MKRGFKLIFVSVILMVSVRKLKAQTMAHAFATATIVTPVTVSSNQSQGYENVDLSKVTAADFTIGAGIEDLYTLTIPQTIDLVKVAGVERITAKLYTATKQEIIYYGKQHCKIDAGITVVNGQAPGRYASQAFDVTVNFN